MGYTDRAGQPGYTGGAGSVPHYPLGDLVYLDHAATAPMLPEAIAAMASGSIGAVAAWSRYTRSPSG